MANKQFNSVDGYAVGNSGSTFNVIDATGNITASGSITRNSRNVPTFVHQADTPPTSPLVGDQWYNTTTGVLFEYLNDGTTSQWVDINGLPGVVGPIVLPGGTANAVVYLNSSGETVSSSSFVFDGTNVGIGNTAPTHTLSVTGTINVSGNANVGNIGATNGVFTSVSGNGSGLSDITGANVAGAVAFATTANSVAGANVSGTVSSATTAGTVTTAAQPNITSVGTLTSLGVSGNITAANITANTGVFTGNGSGLSAIAGANVTGQVGNALVAGTVYTAAQPNITSVGTLTSLTVTGNTFLATTSGNLLVGTTTADNKLTVSSSSSGAAAGVLTVANPNDATNTAADFDFVTHSSGTLATGRIRGFVAGADNYPMSFWTYGGDGLAERMRITATGDVGIGTASPDALLDAQQSANAAVSGRVVNINAGASADARLLVSNGTTQSGMIMRGTGHASANHFVLFQASTTAPMTFFANGSERMRITSAGSVGIGLSNPSSQNTLQVGRNITGSAFASGIVSSGQAQSDVTSRVDLFLSAAAVASGTYPLVIGYQAQQGTFTGTVTTQYGFRADASLVGATNNMGFFGNIPDAANRWNFYAGGTAPNYFAGNVGIGTSSPVTRLQVSAASGYNEIRVSSGANSLGLAIDGSAAYLAAFQSMPLAFQTNATERMRITSAGGLAVGTTTDPGAGNIGLAAGGKLQFSSSAYITPENNVSGAEISTPGAITFRTGSGTPERARIDASGRLGIGTTSPATNLDVNTTTDAVAVTVRATSSTSAVGEFGLGMFNASVPALRGTTTNGLDLGTNSAGRVALFTNNTERMRIDSSGNVGIGTSSPSAKLSIQNGTNAYALVHAHTTDLNGGMASFGSNGYTATSYSFGLTRADTAFSAWAVAAYTLKSAFQDQSAWTVQYMDAAGNQAECMRIDASGNLGLGVTPSAWGGNYRALQIGVGGAISAGNGTFPAYIGISANMYIDGTPAAKYLVSGAAATLYQQSGGEHQFLNAPSGTAGNAITFTQAMTLDASGNLLVGGTSNSLGARGLFENASGNQVAVRYTGIATYYLNATSGGDLAINRDGTERMRIDSSGNLGIGTSSPVDKLQISNALATTGTGIVTGNGITLQNTNATAGNYTTIQNRDAAGNQNAQLQFINVTQGSPFQGVIAFATRNSTGDFGERMRITATGDVGIGTSSPGARIAVAAASPAVGSRGTAYLFSTNAMGANLGGQLSFGGSFTGTSETVFGSIAGRKETGNDNDISGYLQFSTTNASLGNVERMRIDSSGNLLVGTTSGSYKLDVTAGGPTAVFGSASGSGLSAYTAWRRDGTILGYVGNGTGVLAGSGATDFAMGATGARNLCFGTNDTERMRIDASGNLLVGTTSGGQRLTVRSAANNAALGLTADNTGGVGAYVSNVSGTATYNAFQFLTNGGASTVGSIVVSSTSTAYNTTSDARLKENIADADSASSLIDQIKVRKYDWKADGSHQRYGFVAQELVEVAPEAVSVPQDENQMMGVDYSKLVPMLVKALQEANSKIDALEARMSALESAITNLSEGN